eukprot:2522398-Amphidinium_carterae.1
MEGKFLRVCLLCDSKICAAHSVVPECFDMRVWLCSEHPEFTLVKKGEEFRGPPSSSTDDPAEEEPQGGRPAT